MKPWHIVVVVFAALLAVIAIESGGSSDHSSNSPSSSSPASSAWSPEDVASVESKIADGITEKGLTPTKTETECFVKGYEGMGLSASEVLDNAEASPEQEEELRQITSECEGVSSSSGSSSVPSESEEEIYSEAEETLSGPACQEDASSSACQEEAKEKEDQIAEKEGLTPPGE